MFQAKAIAFHTEPELFYEFLDYPGVSIGVNDLIAERIGSDEDYLDPYVFHFAKSHAVRQREGTRDSSGRYTFPNKLYCDHTLLAADLLDEAAWDRLEPDAHSMLCERCVSAKQQESADAEANKPGA